MKVLVDFMPQTTYDYLFAREYYMSNDKDCVTCKLSKSSEDECCLAYNEECPYLQTIDSFLSEKN